MREREHIGIVGGAASGGLGHAHCINFVDLPTEYLVPARLICTTSAADDVLLGSCHLAGRAVAISPQLAPCACARGEAGRGTVVPLLLQVRAPNVDVLPIRNAKGFLQLLIRGKINTGMARFITISHPIVNPAGAGLCQYVRSRKLASFPGSPLRNYCVTFKLALAPCECEFKGHAIIGEPGNVERG